MASPYSSQEMLPRERLIQKGAKYLRDYELLAILLGSGIKGENVFSLSKKILGHLEKRRFLVSVGDLLKINGLGPAKATLIMAMLELGRRILSPHHKKIRNASDALGLLSHYADRPQEYFLAIHMNGANEVLTHHIVSIGLVNQTLVHPREVFAQALELRAAGIIVAHNHPSGNCYPSHEDKIVTSRLVQAGEILGISLFDHLVFSRNGYFSFREEGFLPSVNSH